jgi:hypothetical protein
MGAMIVAYGGETDGTGGATPSMAQRTALFQKVFAGEVLTAFEQATLMLDKHQIRTIQNGKSATFPNLGRVTSGYHVPGDELVSQAVTSNETEILIDGLLYSAIFIDNIDEMMSHFDFRAPYAVEMGRKLAQDFDKSVILTLIRAAKAAAKLASRGDLAAASKVQYLGASYTSGTVAAKAAALATAIFTQSAIWDNQFVPGERYVALTPTDYNAIVQNTDAINSDWGGQGAYSDGTVTKVAGATILKAPSLSSIIGIDTTGISPAGAANAAVATTRGASGDTDVQAVMFTKDAVGTVKLLDISTESAWDIRRQGTLLVAKYAMGHGILRADGAAYFANDAS